MAKLAHQFDEISEADIFDLLEELQEIKKGLSQTILKKKSNKKGLRDGLYKTH